MRAIYIDGDSTTYGMFDKEYGGWADRLHLAALNEGKSFEDMTFVQSRAWPSRTLARILRQADANIKSFSPISDVTVVLQVGMNEAKIFHEPSGPIVPLRLFGEQLIRFSNIVRENNSDPDYNCDAVFVGPPPIDTTRFNPTLSGAVIKDEVLATYGEMMRAVAEHEGYPYVDTRAVFANTGLPISELIDNEGYHPSTLGHATLAKAVAGVLQIGQ